MMDAQEAGLLYNERVRDAHAKFNREFDASWKISDDAERQEEQDRISEEWHNAKREALNFLRPYAPAEWIKRHERGI